MPKQQYDRARELALRWRDCVDARMRPQDYLDLDAGGYLLVALGHLVKAREKLLQEPPSRTRYHTQRWTRYAANYVRRALKLLDELKEETCEKP